MSDRRLVLMPHGLPAHDESRERCSELILRCGGDLGRIFDGSTQSRTRFAAHLAGISDLVNAREIPLVVLTELVPIPDMVFAVRRMLEAELAVLERAPWLLYADRLTSEACVEALQRWGKLDGPLGNAPLWTGSDGLRYLIVSPSMREHTVRALPERVHLVEFGCRTQSATLSRQVTAPESRPTVKMAAYVADSLANARTGKRG